MPHVLKKIILLPMYNTITTLLAYNLPLLITHNIHMYIHMYVKPYDIVLHRKCLNAELILQLTWVLPTL